LVLIPIPFDYLCGTWLVSWWWHDRSWLGKDMYESTNDTWNDHFALNETRHMQNNYYTPAFFFLFLLFHHNQHHQTIPSTPSNWPIRIIRFRTWNTSTIRWNKNNIIFPVHFPPLFPTIPFSLYLSSPQIPTCSNLLKNFLKPLLRFLVLDVFHSVTTMRDWWTSPTFIYVEFLKLLPIDKN